MKKTLLALSVAIAAGTTTLNAQVTNGLVAKYSFNNGNANDEVGTNNGTVNGATLTTDRFGNSNKAYSFNGSSDYIIVPQNSDNDLNSLTNGISISAWINPTVLPSAGLVSIVTKWCSALNEQYGMFLNMFGQTLVAIRVVNNSGITSPNTSVTGTWYHLVFTYDKTTNEHKVYVDNVNTLTQTAVGTYTNSTDATSLSFGAQACDINGGSASPGRYFNGKIDDIRIYNRVLTANEVTTLYNEADPVLGISDLITTNNAIDVYPNPASDVINFSVQTNVQLSNVTGQIIANKTNVNTLDISEQPTGIYFLTLTNDNNQVLQRVKIVKE